MAKASWVRINPEKGSGNREVQVSSVAEHTGRSVRTTVLTFRAPNCPDQPRTVKQAGKPEHVDIAESASAPKEGKLITISGISNSATLTFSLGTGDLAITLPTNYTAGGASTKNGVAIDGDPGASAAYAFSIGVTVPKNTTIQPKTRQIIVTDEGGHTDTCVLTAAAGDAYLTVASGEINLTYQGSPVGVQVTSNTSWTVV